MHWQIDVGLKRDTNTNPATVCVDMHVKTNVRSITTAVGRVASSLQR